MQCPSHSFLPAWWIFTSSLKATRAIVHCRPRRLGAVYYSRCCGHTLSRDECTVMAVVCFNMRWLSVSQWCTHEQTEQTSQKACTPALSHQPHGSHGARADFERLYRHRETQNTVLSGGVLVGWHWEHLWLKGKRMGREIGGGGAWRGKGHKTGGAQTLHCTRPQQMGKAKYAASFLVNQWMRQSCREEHQKASRPPGSR